MTNQHPITPPPELVQQWRKQMPAGIFDGYEYPEREKALCLVAAQWGADQELEACIEWVSNEISPHIVDMLRTARRPKPLTLNSIALQMLGTIERDAHYLPEITDIIRRALEALP
jgi:hypothetical protein